MNKIKNWKNIVLLVVIVLVLLLIIDVMYGYIKKQSFEVKNPIVTMEVENYGTMKFELYPEQAPNTVANFITLINRGFYNGLTFHRTIPGFMIQGGDKTGTGTGNPTYADLEEGGENVDYSIKGEFIANGVKNSLKHERGVIAMARSDYSNVSSSLLDEGYNSAGSQFYIVDEDSSSLDGLYATFGKLIEGYEVLDKIADVEVYYRESELAEGETAPTKEDGTTISSDTPKEEVKIKTVTVETNGINYGKPDTMEAFDYNKWITQMYSN